MVKKKTTTKKTPAKKTVKKAKPTTKKAAKPAKKATKPKKATPSKKKEIKNKIALSDLAKELGLSSQELIKSLADLGVHVKPTVSSIDEESAKIVRELLKPAVEEKKAKPKPEVKEPIKKKKEEPEKIEPKIAEEVKETLPGKPQPPPVKPVQPVTLIIETDDITVKDLAEKLNVKVSEIIKALMMKSIMANINQRIAADLAKDIAAGLDKHLVIKKPEEAKIEQGHKIENKNLKTRPPIVTIMGHVDHGKTKLLDAIRKTRVAEGEAGGITQHIGAYQVNVHGKKVTFLDTPGHEAFTALRARGAKVTDIAVLVVAADDGVKPQTIEAIDHAKAAGVPIIVAINKIDKPEANLDKVKQQLSEHDLSPEDWGGKTVMVPTSAIDGKGVDELLEMILLVAEVQELKADAEGTASGVVIESRIEKGRGPVASILVKNGTIKIGDIFTIGSTYGKVRALFTDTGARIEKAGPAMPIELLGCEQVPKPGDVFQKMPHEKEARALAEQRQQGKAKASRRSVVSLEDFSKHIKEGEVKDLKLVVKADVQGSLDGIAQSIQNMVIGNIKINIIHSAVGPVTGSDVMLAEASNAVILAFNVAFEGNAENESKEEGVEVRRYNIIYKLIDDVKLAMEGMLEPVYEEVVLGHAEVRNLFKFSKVGVIAGCFVKDGKMQRGVMMRQFRGKEKIYEGKLEALKRFKDDVKSVEQNFECGISIQGYSNFKEGDIIEAYEVREKARKK